MVRHEQSDADSYLARSGGVYVCTMFLSGAGRDGSSRGVGIKTPTARQTRPIAT